LIFIFAAIPSIRPIIDGIMRGHGATPASEQTRLATAIPERLGSG
jgi:hypothetical protein